MPLTSSLPVTIYPFFVLWVLFVLGPFGSDAPLEQWEEQLLIISRLGAFSTEASSGIPEAGPGVEPASEEMRLYLRAGTD